MDTAAGPQPLHDWQRHMSELVASLASAGNVVLPYQLVEPLQRQLELTRTVVERQRRLEQALASQIVAPFDAVFDLVQESATTMRRQAEALQAAGRALEESAALMKLQAEQFEQTIAALRRPAEIAKTAAGIGRPRQAPAREP